MGRAKGAIHQKQGSGQEFSRQAHGAAVSMVAGQIACWFRPPSKNAQAIVGNCPCGGERLEPLRPGGLPAGIRRIAGARLASRCSTCWIAAPVLRCAWSLSRSRPASRPSKAMAPRPPWQGGAGTGSPPPPPPAPPPGHDIARLRQKEITCTP